MADKFIRCVILRDMWDKDGKRHREGSEVDIPAEAAMDGVETGALARVKTKPAKQAKNHEN